MVDYKYFGKIFEDLIVYNDMPSPFMSVYTDTHLYFLIKTKFHIIIKVYLNNTLLNTFHHNLNISNQLIYILPNDPIGIEIYYNNIAIIQYLKI